MTFMTLKILLSKNTKVLLIIAFFSFFFLLPIFFNERPHTTFLAFEEGSVDFILRRKMASTTFSRKFNLNFCLSPFVVLFANSVEKLNNGRC